MAGVGVVTVVHGRHGHLAAQRQTLARSAALPDVHVVVAVDDLEVEDVVAALPALRSMVVPVDRDPWGLPLAAARNWGMDLAVQCGCDVLIGLDVDCLVGHDLVGGYAEVVRRSPESVWSGPVTYLDPPARDGYPLDALAALDAPHPARPAPAPGQIEHGADPELFWSLSYALSASAWMRAGGYGEEYVGYGAEDTDFGQRASAAGLDLAWVGAARAFHQHHAVSDPPVEHVDDILRNGSLYRRRWGSWPMQGWLDAFEQRGLVRRRGDGYERVTGG